MKTRSMLSLSLGLVTCAGAAPTDGDTPQYTPEQVTFFENRVRPVLAEHCFRCHGQEAKSKDKLKGGLLMDGLARLLKGGDSGPAIVPGTPDASLLIKGIRYTDNELEMPPRQKLSGGQIAT